MNSQEIREIVKAEYGQAALQAKRGRSRYVVRRTRRQCPAMLAERARPLLQNSIKGSTMMRARPLIR